MSFDIFTNHFSWFKLSFNFLLVVYFSLNLVYVHSHLGPAALTSSHLTYIVDAAEGFRKQQRKKSKAMHVRAEPGPCYMDFTYVNVFHHHNHHEVVLGALHFTDEQN